MFQLFPNEIIISIISHLKPVYRLPLKLINKRFYDIISYLDPDRTKIELISNLVEEKDSRAYQCKSELLPAIFAYYDDLKGVYHTMKHRCGESELILAYATRACAQNILMHFEADSKEMWKHAFISERLDTVKIVFERFGLPTRCKYLSISTVPIYVWLRENGLGKYRDEIPFIAIRRIELLKYLVDYEGDSIISHYNDYCVFFRDIEWAFSRGARLSRFEAYLLADSHPDKIPHVFKNHREQVNDWNIVLECLISKNHNDLVILLTSNGIQLNANSLYVNNRILRYLLDNHYEITKQVSEYCNEDYADVVKYLHDHHYPIMESHVIKNIVGQSVYLMENKYPLPVIVQKCLEGLKWAIHAGYLFPIDTTVLRSKM